MAKKIECSVLGGPCLHNCGASDECWYAAGGGTEPAVDRGGVIPIRGDARVGSEPFKGNRGQRALVNAATQLEGISFQLHALASEHLDEDRLNGMEDAVALRIAKALREKGGAFQMAREAVAQWIEEGKWRD